MTVLQRKASMQQNAFLLVPAIKGCIYISTLFLASQPTLIKLDNENIGGHLTPLQSHLLPFFYYARLLLDFNNISVPLSVISF